MQGHNGLVKPFKPGMPNVKLTPKDVEKLRKGDNVRAGGLPMQEEGHGTQPLNPPWIDDVNDRFVSRSMRDRRGEHCWCKMFMPHQRLYGGGSSIFLPIPVW